MEQGGNCNANQCWILWTNSTECVKEIVGSLTWRDEKTRSRSELRKKKSTSYE